MKSRLLVENFAVFFHKFLDPAGGVYQFLFTGEKRVAAGTDLDLNLVIDRTHFYLAAASTGSNDFIVFRMNVFFHR